MRTNLNRLDLKAIVDMIADGARVLDLGCGDGTLLAQLVAAKNVVARGVEISGDNVRACIALGLSVRQGNIEEGLADYRDHAFDYVILSQTIAYLNLPDPVVREMLRVGRHAIISFDNAGHWRARAKALLGYGMGNPLDSCEPRVRAITMDHFQRFCAGLGARIERAIYLSGPDAAAFMPRLLATTAVYEITR